MNIEPGQSVKQSTKSKCRAKRKAKRLAKKKEKQEEIRNIDSPTFGRIQEDLTCNIGRPADFFMDTYIRCNLNMRN